MGIIIELKNKNFEIIRCITGNQDQGEQKVIIGTGQESSIKVDDPSWESIQFEIFSKEEKYYLRAYKCQFLTLFKIPMNKNTIVTTRDFLLLANSEGFMITNSCGINNLTDDLKKIILETDSNIIHPKIKEPPEVMGNSTDPKLVIRFVKGEYIGRVYEFTIQDKIAFGREKLKDHQNIIFSSNLISDKHLLMFFDEKYGCWMVKDGKMEGSLNCSYLALTTNSSRNRSNREQLISPDFYMPMDTQCEFVTASTSLIVIYFIYIYIYIYIYIHIHIYIYIYLFRSNHSQIHFQIDRWVLFRLAY